MIYFDNNATTQIADEAFEAMLPFIKGSFGNLSSNHGAIEEARASVAELLRASSPGEIVFTSGGTESDNWAIRVAMATDATRNKIVITRVEHEAVRKTCEQLELLGTEVVWLDVDSDGALDLEELSDSVDERTALVSVMWANNETGVLFPVAQVAGIVKSRSNALFHVDAVSAAGRIPVDVSISGIDLLSISAHKFHGPKDAGALFVRNGVEFDRREESADVPQIVGMGAAAKLVSDLTPMKLVEALRDRLESSILSAIPASSVNGTRASEHRLPNTSNISFVNTNGEMLLSMLDDHGISVSTGSACNSETHTSSHVLAAMNIPYSQVMGSIRFSLGRYSTEAEVDRVIELLPELVSGLRT
jgi:cysteine desulfurase